MKSYLSQNIASNLSQGTISMCPISQVIFPYFFFLVQTTNSEHSENCKIRIFYSMKEKKIIKHSFFSARLFCLCFSIASASRPLFLLPKCVVPKKKKKLADSKKRAKEELLLLKEIEGEETENAFLPCDAR